MRLTWPGRYFRLPGSDGRALFDGRPEFLGEVTRPQPLVSAVPARPITLSRSCSPAWHNRESRDDLPMGADLHPL